MIECEIGPHERLEGGACNRRRFALHGDIFQHLLAIGLPFLAELFRSVFARLTTSAGGFATDGKGMLGSVGERTHQVDPPFYLISRGDELQLIPITLPAVATCHREPEPGPKACGQLS